MLLESQAGLPAKVTELANVGLSLLPSTLGLRGGSEATSQFVSHNCSEAWLGDFAPGSEILCKPAGEEVVLTDVMLLVACKRLLLPLTRLASLSVLAGCKSSLLTSNSPKSSASSSPDSVRSASITGRQSHLIRLCG